MDRSAFVPEGWPRVIPRVFVRETRALVEFVQQVFDASGAYRDQAPSELRIGDSLIMISDGAGVRREQPAFLYVYVPDADATYQRALAAGAHSVEAPTDTPYGDRRGTVEDRWGNTWQIATHRAR